MCEGFAMLTKRSSALLSCLALLSLLFLVSCSGSNATGSSTATPTLIKPTKTALATQPVQPTKTPPATATQGVTPSHYIERIVFSGKGRPDDLIFDPQGRLVFSDFYNGNVRRLNANGSVTTIIGGLAGPEGLVYLPDGTLIIAEQRTNRILKLSPDGMSLTVLRTLPGVPSSQPCKDGVDGIALDPATKTLIVPDSPIGNVYRMSLDGLRLQLLASGITRPVGATVDARGNIFVADECGGAVWRITPGGTTTRMGGFGMPDDVVFDPQGNLLVIDLQPSIHALVRVLASTGQHEVLASKGFIEPQGLAVTKNGTIFVSDDYADIIVEFTPA
jgi:sugar lactone lactonase YvrE